MNWKDISNAVATMAPAAGAALAGPAGGAVGAAIASMLGVPADPSSVSQALKTNPEAAIKLREIEANLEAELIKGRAQVITAEANSESWLAANWRPLTMLSFVGLIWMHWLGLTPDNLPASQVEMVMDIIQLAIGGYVVGRSVEKTAKTVTGKGIYEQLK